MDEADDGCLLTGFEGACVFSAKQTNATAQINVKKKIQEASKNQELHKVFSLLRKTFELKIKTKIRASMQRHFTSSPIQND